MYLRLHRSVPNRIFLAALAITILSSYTSFVEAQNAPAPAKADAADKDTKFLRFVEDDDGGGKLETAIATYRDKDGKLVHLVAAVHIGERAYYENLAKTFSGYDAVLYEMVKPKDAPIPGVGVRSDSIVSMFQRMMKDVLELEFQLDALDYNARNFIHADLDAETFSQMQADRGENLLTLMLKQMMAEMEKPTQMPEITLAELAAALLSPDSSRHFKLMLARQFEDMEAKVAGLEGKNGTVILTERNKAAVKVLQEQLAAGKKNLGVFYGAAHMPDLAKRVRQMGFKPAGETQWKKAWDLTIRADQPSAIEQLFMDAIDALDEPEPAAIDPEDEVF